MSEPTDTMNRLFNLRRARDTLHEALRRLDKEAWQKTGEDSIGITQRLVALQRATRTLDQEIATRRNLAQETADRFDRYFHLRSARDAARSETAVLREAIERAAPGAKAEEQIRVIALEECSDILDKEVRIFPSECAGADGPSKNHDLEARITALEAKVAEHAQWLSYQSMTMADAGHV